MGEMLTRDAFKRREKKPVWVILLNYPNALSVLLYGVERHRCGWSLSVHWKLIPKWANEWAT